MEKGIKIRFFSYGDLDFLIAIALKYSKSLAEIGGFLINILKIKHVSNFEVKFNLNSFN